MSKIIRRFRILAINGYTKYLHLTTFTKNTAPLHTVNVFRSSNTSFKVFTLLALFWPLSKEKKADDSNPIPSNIKLIEEGIKEADQLYDNGQYSDCLDFLQNLNEKFDTDVEVLWRKSRVLYQLAKQPGVDQKHQSDLANEAFTIISKALTLDENNFAVHKWMSVILDLKASCESLKERIKQLETVKKHMLRAVELNPRDATTLYMLGEWCYRIADMPWYQRKIAQTLFATPPTSSFDEAIKYFSRAEVVDPRFYSMNLLMLGKTYIKLGKEDIGKYYLNLALLYPARSNDDHQANKEAQDILKRLK